MRYVRRTPTSFGCAVRPASHGTPGDGAQQRLRQAKGAKQLDDSARFFVRQDGTRAYYFSVEQLCAMWQQAGFDVLRCERPVRQSTWKTSPDDPDADPNQVRVLGAEDSQPQEGPRARALVRHREVPQAAGRPPGRRPPGRRAATAAAVTAAAVHRGRGAGRPRRRHRGPRACGAAFRTLAGFAPAHARAAYSGASTAGGVLLVGGRCARGSGRERCGGRPC